MKYRFALLLIVSLTACSTNEIKSALSFGKVVEKYEYLNPDQITLKRDGNTAILYYSSEEISKIELFAGGGRSISGVRTHNARLSWRCDAEFSFYESDDNSHKCIIYQAKAATFSVSKDNKRTLEKLHDEIETNCFGIAGMIVMPCKEFDQGHEKRKEIMKYRSAYQRAELKGNYTDFIATYKNNDIDGLVPIAIQKQKELDQKAMELLEQKRKAEEKERLAKIGLINRFRSNLSIGNETNCGLVVEIKSPIVKVQSPIGELWLKIDEVYPSGLSNCLILNGVYIHNPPF